MKPLRLKMQAFGSYGKETVIDFEKVNQNLFLITGDTGAGKTTIFDAIVFALYGEASSSTNKKDGVVLQSQYVDFAQEPFVELVFAEGQGETREVYTVRRVPRHLKMITRGAAKGKQREVTGSVSLIMPDGTEYPSKETDRKLQEITGLTKGQFMQVAMIAQGEFVELLRARSDDKKVIFRKLFNTEMYQEIVAELGNRKRAKEKEIAVLKTQCQSEVSRIRIPEIYGSEILKQLKKQLEEGEMTRLTDFLKELEILCDWLGKHTREAEKEYQEAAKKRDEKREAYTRAEELLKWFVQLEDAEQKLQQYASDEGRIKEMQGLLGRIRDTWEIRENYMILSDAQKHLRDLEEALLSQEKRLPMLKNAREAAESAEEQAKQTYDQELQNYSRISEKVQKSLEVLAQIKNLSIQTETDRKSYNEATRKTQKTQQQQETLEQKAEQWKIQSEELAEVDKKLAVAEGKKEEADAVSQEISDVRTLGNQAEQCRKKAIKAREDYVRITEDYNAANTKYESMRQRFLNAQAGFLAEELEPGKPCPVCGSTEHPNPHKRAVEYVDISEEKLQNMQINVDKLRKKQEKSAGDVAVINKEAKNYFNDSPYAAGNVKSTLSLTPFNIVGVVNDGRDFPTIYADSAAILNFAPAMWQVQNANVYWHPTTGLTIEQIHSALGDILTDTIGGYWESAGRSDIGDTYDSVLSILQLGLLVTSLLLLFVSVLGQINIGLSSLEQRTHELLIRRAIGASRTNIVALVLGSQLILSIFVCLAAILISLILVHCIGALLPVDSPVGTPSYPISVAVVAVAVSVLTALLGGLLPALKAAKLEPALALR